MVLTASLSVQAGAGTSVRHVPNEIIVKLRSSATSDATQAANTPLQKLRRRHPAHEIKPLLKRSGRQLDLPGREAFDPDRVYRVRLSDADDVDIEAVLQAYRAQADVEYAERNPVVSACVEPDDPRFDSQWALEKIAAAQAWDTCRGSGEVVVAVIDTGVDYAHRDLAANAWRNEAEYNGLAGVDDDENGFVDDIWGYNFIYNNSEPMDDHGHGTHCAGIIAAVGNNGLDVSGVCWQARIMAVKMLGFDGDGSAADGAVAVYYAVANGADIISCSWGGREPSALLGEAIAYAHSRGVLVVAAAGNEDTDDAFYPAVHTEVIAVAATGPSDRRWSASNYGAWVDIAAPGQGVLSLRPTSAASGLAGGMSTTELSGTSMATPHIAGAAALLRSANPVLTNDELREMLLSTGDTIASGICNSNARVNVTRALEAAIPTRGIFRFDRDVYAQGNNVDVLLADGQLKGAAAQTVLVLTTRGDFETVTLAETDVSQGVFRATLSSVDEAVVRQDGRLQVGHGERIWAYYEDLDIGSDGGTQWMRPEARMDGEPPTIEQVTVEMAGPVARVELTTNESTTARIRYGQVVAGQATLTQRSETSEASELHQIKLRGLVAGAGYEFVVDLADVAGNDAVADNAGVRYPFVAEVDANGFRVPEVYATIQAAIDDAWDGDTIWVADGTYRGTGNIEIDLQGKAITVRSENGPENCIIDCQELGCGFYVQSGEDERTVIQGFTIRNGYSDFGGGMLCAASSPTIDNCIFVDNHATRYGGGLCNWYNSSPTVTNCRFESNWCSDSDGRGGGMANRRSCSPLVQNCTFIDNTAPHYGGGMDNYDESHARVLDCHFENNTTDYGGAVSNADSCQAGFKRCSFVANSGENGGAIYNSNGSDVTIEQCIFTGNVAGIFGGAIRIYESLTAVTNCTVFGNHAGGTCGGVDGGRRSTVLLVNSIIWGNTDGNADEGDAFVESAQITRENGSTATDYCCIEGWSGGSTDAGTFARAPLFADAANGDFHLLSAGGRWDDGLGLWVYDAVTSPCIDAGNPGWSLGDELVVSPDDPDVSLDNPRVNLGAYGRTAQASIAPSGWMLLTDLTNDGAVDWLDLSDVAARWLETGARQTADVNRDGLIDAADFTRLASQWHHQAGQNGVQATP